ncbi:hypothetical protein LTR62_002152 [Meristemomyces frigidus]|uniref:RCC1-like domain-containing protein n=1 Tax=Meristemomyces frigidus TaxID=1508187 RepID=A0AAN7TAH7_9PEZI|nr:hypothetical protein LTR62_002152 [Meristemomyces frigidus]
MPPKRAASKAAAPVAKANTKAKLTKPAPTTETKTETAKPKATRATTEPAPKKSPAETMISKAETTTKADNTTTTKKTSTTGTSKKAAPKKTTTKASATAAATATAAKKGTKRKAEDDASAPPAKKPAAKKATLTTTSARTKREAPDDADEAPAPVKKTKVMKKNAVINRAPAQKLNVFVFGEGTAGELGLGTSKKAIDVKRPRLNPALAADKVGVVQIEAGGMHVVALTHDNKLLTWGVNDQGALGRDTTWDGGLKDMKDGDAEEDSDDEVDDNGLNPKECNPAEVDFSKTELAEDTRWVQVTAGDSCTFALTDDGRVYGWGTFRGNEGIFGFDPQTEVARLPRLVPDLKKITKITAGANHVLALDSNGSVFAWGSGQQNQLGRRIVERTKLEGLKPREFGLPKSKKNHIVDIATGSYHSFAIDMAGNVYGWGLNNFGETGIPDNAGQDDALILKPKIIEALRGKNVISIQGGGHHSLCATADGDCLVWGRMDSAQSGIEVDDVTALGEDVVIFDEKSKPRIIKVPTKVTAIDGAASVVASSSDHSVVITKEGRAWSWGFSANYQTGQGTTEDVEEATMIENTATRDVRLNFATTGGQFSIVTSSAL